MSDQSRAKSYVGLFISAEDKGHPWHYMAPVDGKRSGDTLRLGDVLMERLNARSWRVTADGESVVWAAQPAKQVAS